MSKIQLAPYINFQGRAGDNMAIALSGRDLGRLTEIFNDSAEGGRDTK